MKAIWNEVVRAFRMTFVDGLAALLRGERHSGWVNDPHLRKGYYTGLPVAVLGMVITISLFLQLHSTLLFFLIYLPSGLIAMMVWFGVAARSRAKAEER